MTPRIRIGVSACLAGELVRYDGGHKRNQWICKQLTQHAELIRVCPEAGAGMGIPRPPIQLIESNHGIRARGIADPATDFTRPLKEFSANTIHALDDISGFIFKARSPSCGLGSTPIHRQHAKSLKGNGLFADSVLKSMTLLPVSEESQLEKPEGREHFLEQVYTYQEWRRFEGECTSTQQLLQYHQHHRLQLMAHGYDHLRNLEQLLQQNLLKRTLIKQYGTAFMKILRYHPTASKHRKVLGILCEKLQKEITGKQLNRLQAKIDQYRYDTITLTTVLKEIKRLVMTKDIQNEAIQQYLSAFLPLTNR